MSVTLYQGDCLQELDRVADGSVHLICSDLPYGTTACAWDSVIPLEPLWAHFKRILTPRGAVVLTAAQPFTTTLISSNRAWFKYTWAWEKTVAVGFLNARNAPLKAHEDICIFSPGTIANKSPRRMTYNPQIDCTRPAWRKVTGRWETEGGAGSVFERGGRRSHQPAEIRGREGRQPRSVIRFGNGNYRALHPTQKPLALLEYLIATYSNPGDVVLDATFGSNTTGEAAVNLGRSYIGIERDPGYFAQGATRTDAAQARLHQLPLAV